MTTRLLSLSSLCALLLATAGLLRAQVPPILNYQGRVAVDGTNFEGSGQFKFALVNAAGTTTFWSNDGTSAAGSEPTAAVSLAVAKGLYSVALGDAALAGMTAVPASVFAQADVRLRVWFNDGVHGFQLLTPDQRLASAGYALMAATVPANAITSANLAPLSVGTSQLAFGAVTGAQLAAGATAPAVRVSGAAATNSPGTYAATNPNAPAVFSLPMSSSVGDIVRLTGTGAGGWELMGPWTGRESERLWAGIAAASGGTHAIGCALGGRLYLSADDGLTWTARESTRSWRSVAMSADGSRAFATTSNDAYVYTSSDFGATWTQRPFPASHTLAIATSANGLKLLAANDGGGNGGFLYTSTDSGVSWTARKNDAPRHWLSVASSADGTKLVAVHRSDTAPGGLYTSTDSGVTWTERDTPRDWRVVASNADGTVLVAGVRNGFLYVSTDSGLTWTQRANTDLWYCASVSADGTRILAGANPGRFRISLDQGLTWIDQDASRSFNGAAMSGDGLKMYLAPAGSTLLTYGRTASGGQGTSTSYQYVGNGVWIPVAETQVAAGAVGSAQIANGAVGTNQLGAGAVGTAQLASAAVGSAQLAPNLTLGGTTQQNGSLVIDSAGSNSGDLAAGLLFGGTSSGEGLASNRGTGFGNHGLTFFTNFQPRMTITQNGRVGIGTEDPEARLSVVGSVTTPMTYGYLNGAGTTGFAILGNSPVSIRASDRIAATEFNAYSDARIKTVAGVSDARADLATLRRIEITDYTFRDQVAKGGGVQKKVIAQQVEGVFPQAVSQGTGVVPDIFRAGKMRDGWIELAEPSRSSEEPTLAVGERVRLIAEGVDRICEVLAVRPGAIRIAWEGPAVEKVFVYGREVRDFRMVDYEALSMLHVSATQELARRLESKEAELTALRRDVRELQQLLRPTATTVVRPSSRADLVAQGPAARRVPNR